MNLKSNIPLLMQPFLGISDEYSEPLFLSCSDIDHTFDTESRRRALDLLHTGNTPYQLQLFANVEHGFALRGNMENPYERESL